MKKSTRRGSLFGKLIGSYVIFSMAAILLLIVAVLISFVFSYGNVLQENFPGITVGADGTIQNLDGIRNMNGWVHSTMWRQFMAGSRPRRWHIRRNSFWMPFR